MAYTRQQPTQNRTTQQQQQQATHTSQTNISVKLTAQH